MKKGKKILIIIAIVIVCVLVFKDFFIKNAITMVGSRVVGTKLSIDKFSFKVFSQKIHVQGIRLYNPEGFPAEPLILIDEALVKYNLGEMLTGKLHFPEMILDVRELVVVKNEAELLNVDELPIVKAQAQEPVDEKEEAAQPKKEPGQEMNLQIDLLKLNVGKVVYKDFTKGEEPTTEAYDVGLNNKEYKNITSANQLVGLILVEAMKGTAIKGAKIYGMASLASIAGMGFLPAGVATVLVSKDHFEEEFGNAFEEVYSASLALFEEKGRLDHKDKEKGIVKGKMEGCDVAIKIQRVSEGRTKITVSARKMFLPKPKIAGGVVHQISRMLE